MARNGSGTMSPSQTFTPSTPALSADVNSVIQDIADEITNSLALDGQSVMTGPIKAATGSAGAPGYTFGSALTTGFYLSGGLIHASIGGVAQGPVINPSTFSTSTPSTGTSAYVIGGLSPAGFTLAAFRRVLFIVGDTNTSTTNTAAVNGTTAKNIVKRSTSGYVPLAIGDLVEDELVELIYDGTQYVLTEDVSQGFGPQLAITAAATTDLGTKNSHNILINGTTGITAFGSGANASTPLYLIKFSGILTMTNSAGLALVGGADITTAAGDYALALYLGSGNWAVIAYFRASGKALIETDQFPSQTGNALKMVTTDGTNKSWSGRVITAQGTLNASAVVTGGENIASAAKGGSGIYDVTMSITLPNLYKVFAFLSDGSFVGVAKEIPTSRTTTGFRIATALTNGVAQDFAAVEFIVVGGL
jgi:hypothetical protein